MDYGRPAAQFMAQDVAALAEPYIGKKITVQGWWRVGISPTPMMRS